MKQLVLVAMLAALASSALTLLGVHAMAPGGVEGPRPGPPSGGQVDLSEVVKELAALRRELGEALRTAVPQAQPATAPSGGTSGPGGRVIAVPYEGRGLAPAEAVPSTTRYTRMAETLEPDHETEGRQQVGKGPRARWMVRSEREVVDWFGPPDKVQVYEDGSEYWTFRTPKDSGIEGKDGLTFHIHEGRVIDVY